MFKSLTMLILVFSLVSFCAADMITAWPEDKPNNDWQPLYDYTTRGTSVTDAAQLTMLPSLDEPIAPSWNDNLFNLLQDQKEYNDAITFPTTGLSDLALINDYVPPKPEPEKEPEHEKKLFGFDLPEGVTAYGPGIKRIDDGFTLEKTIVAAPKAELKKLLDLLKQKFGKDIEVLTAMLDALHYSFKGERLLISFKVRFTRKEPPVLLQSHVVIGTITPEEKRQQRVLEAQQRRHRPLGSTGLLDVAGLEPIKVDNSHITNVKIPRAAHRLEISMAVLKKMLAFYTKPILNKEFKQETKTMKLKARLERFGIENFIIPGRRARDFICLIAKIKGDVWEDLTGPFNYKSFYIIDSYAMGLQFHHNKDTKGNKLSVVVSGTGNVVMYDDSIAATLGNWLAKDSVLGNIRNGIENSIDGLGGTLKNFVETGDVKMKSVETKNSWESQGDIHFDLCFETNPITIDISKTITKYFGENFPYELSRFKIYEGDRMVIDLNEK